MADALGTYPTWAWVAQILSTICIIGGGFWLKVIYNKIESIERQGAERQKIITIHGERIARNEAAQGSLMDWMSRIDARMTAIDAKLDRIIEGRRNQ